MIINGIEYRLSWDCSLWQWTDRGQRVLSDDEALRILLGSSNPQAWAWADLIHSRHQTARKQWYPRTATAAEERDLGECDISGIDTPNPIG